LPNQREAADQQARAREEAAIPEGYKIYLKP
jgi:hypothetical protein